MEAGEGGGVRVRGRHSLGACSVLSATFAEGGRGVTETPREKRKTFFFFFGGQVVREKERNQGSFGEEGDERGGEGGREEEVGEERQRK